MSKELQNNFPNYETLTSRKAYDFYRKNRKRCPSGINEYNLYKKAISGIFNIIGTMMVESEGGVYIEGFGYLCMIAYPNEWKDRNTRGKSLFQRLKKHQYYFPYFIPDVELKGWTLSEAFEDKLIRKAHAQDIKYKLHFDIVNTIRIANDYSKKAVNHRKSRGEFDYRGQLIKKLNK